MIANNSSYVQLAMACLLSLLGVNLALAATLQLAQTDTGLTAGPIEAPEPAEIPEPTPLVTEPEPAPAPAKADKSASPAIKSGAGNRYVVKKGDTLWGIAGHFLQDPWRWPEVWQVNPGIRNPHLIYPGDVIALRYVDGKPVLVLEGTQLPEQDYSGRKVVKLSPSARVEKLHKAVSSLPKEAIAPFLQHPYLLSRDDLDQAPYVVSSLEEHLANGTGGRIYVKGLEHTTNTSFVIVRRGSEYVDPDTEEVLGLEAINLADASLIKVGSPSTVLIRKARLEVNNGDYLIPVEKSSIDPSFFPRAPRTPVSGKIISVYQGVTKIGQYNVVVINRGEEHGLEPGHILEVHQAGATVRDPIDGDDVILPDERAGVVMVFRPYRKVSFALVMEASRDMRVFDLVKTP